MQYLSQFAVIYLVHSLHWKIAPFSLLDYPWLLAVGLFLAIFMTQELGYRLSQRTRVNSDHENHEQIVGLRDAMLLLLSFMLGFTFSMALTRYDLRYELLVDEANAINATSLRAQMLPEDQQGKLLDLLRQYVESRVELDDAGLDVHRRQAALDQAECLQHQLWGTSVAISRHDRSSVFAEFMKSLNDAMSLDEKRRAAMENRIPSMIWFLIMFITLLAVFTAGYSLHKRFWFATILLPLIFAAVISLIADLDAPNSGLIRAGREITTRLQQDLHRER